MNFTKVLTFSKEKS